MGFFCFLLFSIFSPSSLDERDCSSSDSEAVLALRFFLDLTGVSAEARFCALSFFGGAVFLGAWVFGFASFPADNSSCFS